MTPRSKWGLAAGGAVIAAAIVYSVMYPAATQNRGGACIPHARASGTAREPLKFQCPNDPSKICYKDYYGTTVPIMTKVGHSYGVGSAHGTGMVGRDFILWPLLDQCPISGPENAYPRPPDEAGPEVQAWWDFYWKDPGADHHRCYFLPPGMNYHPPPPDSQIPHCEFTPTPIPVSPTAPVPTPVPTGGSQCVYVTVTPQTICVTKTPTN